MHAVTSLVMALVFRTVVVATNSGVTFLLILSHGSRHGRLVFIFEDVFDTVFLTRA